MARLAGGHEFLEAAVTQAASAKTISELRMAQALLMPLKFGLSLDDTSVALGLSKSWTLRLRQRFGRIQGGQEQPKSKRGQRNRARMTLEEEAALLAPYIEQARQGGVIIVPPLKAKLEKALGRSMAQSTVYAMLHRHGWRKLAPDKRHPESDQVAQEEWKKNSPKLSTRPADNSTGRRRWGSCFRTRRDLDVSRKRDAAGVQSLFVHLRKRW